MARTTNDNSEFATSSYAAVVASIAALLTILISSTGLAQSSKLITDEGKRDIVEKVRQYPDSSIEFENFDGVPLLIQAAHVKEIGSAEYYQLTGLTTMSYKCASFPNVTLTNSTSHRVTGLVLVVGNKQTKRMRVMSYTKINIEPHESYSVAASDWLRPETKVKITRGGKVVKQAKPDLDSEKMWLQASAGDLLLRIAEVTFENGNTWTMDPSMDW